MLESIYFGGGTPSLMEPETVAAVIAAARRAWPQVNDIEITLEANPGSVEAGRFRAYAEAGVNRVSMGLQAMNDNDLKRLGRIHTVDEARAALEVAQAQFARTSFDLIYARQGQSLGDWRAELKEALALAGDHLSLYQLTIESGTAFGDRYRAGKLRGLPDENLAADMFEATQEICGAAGLNAYEVSNHARPGAESRHNLIYWRYGDYVGIGPGAHGRVTLEGKRYATETWRAPEKWLDAVDLGSGESRRDRVSADEQGEELVMMGLRLRDGISLPRYEQITGAALPEKPLTRLQELGMLRCDGDRIAATDAGRMVLNAVLREILAG